MSSLGRYSSNSLRRLISSLNSIRFKDEVGEVEYFGQKVVMLRRDAFSLMQKELTKVGGAAADIILGIAGRRVGSEEGRALLPKAEALGLKSPQSLPDFIKIAVEETNMGYGKIRADDLDIKAGAVNVSISNSFEAEPAGHSLKSGCVYTLSYLEGIFSQLVGKDIRGKEVYCRAKGDAVCRFMLSAIESKPGNKP